MSMSTMRSPSIETRSRKTPWRGGVLRPDVEDVGLAVGGGGAVGRGEVRIHRAPAHRDCTPGSSKGKAREARVVPLHLQEVLAQGMARVSLPEEEPPEVGMALEAHAHQVVGLALLQERPPVDRADARHGDVLAAGGAHLHDELVVQVERLQVVDHLEVGVVVDGAEVGELRGVELPGVPAASRAPPPGAPGRRRPTPGGPPRPSRGGRPRARPRPARRRAAGGRGASAPLQRAAAPGVGEPEGEHADEERGLPEHGEGVEREIGVRRRPTGRGRSPRRRR